MIIKNCPCSQKPQGAAPRSRQYQQLPLHRPTSSTLHHPSSFLLSFPPSLNTPNSPVLSPTGKSFLCPTTLLCPLTTSHPHCPPWPALSPERTPAVTVLQLPSRPAVACSAPAAAQPEGPSSLYRWDLDSRGDPRHHPTALPWPSHSPDAAFMPSLSPGISKASPPFSHSAGNCVFQFAAFMRELYILRPPN